MTNPTQPQDLADEESNAPEVAYFRWDINWQCLQQVSDIHKDGEDVLRYVRAHPENTQPQETDGE